MPICQTFIFSSSISNNIDAGKLQKYEHRGLCFLPLWKICFRMLYRTAWKSVMCVSNNQVIIHLNQTIYKTGHLWHAYSNICFFIKNVGKNWKITGTNCFSKIFRIAVETSLSLVETKLRIACVNIILVASEMELRQLGSIYNGTKAFCCSSERMCRPTRGIF